SVGDGGTSGGSENTSAAENGDGGGAELSGTLPGSGASSQENAQNGWIAAFTEANPGVTVSYDPTGSGTGREQSPNGSVLDAGSDAALKGEEIAQATERCLDGEALEPPLYISPIAIVYNLPGLDAEHLNLTPAALAGI